MGFGPCCIADSWEAHFNHGPELGGSPKISPTREQSPIPKLLTRAGGRQRKPPFRRRSFSPFFWNLQKWRSFQWAPPNIDQLFIRVTPADSIEKKHSQALDLFPCGPSWTPRKSQVIAPQFSRQSQVSFFGCFGRTSRWRSLVYLVSSTRETHRIDFP